MTITYANIKHILELLTTTEWINKEDPRVKLEKLRREISTIQDTRIRTAKEQAIETIQRNIDSNKPFKLTLEKAHISIYEAKTLLSNLHLLYNTESGFRTESKNALITLLKENFDALNSFDVSKLETQQAFHSYNPFPSNFNGLLNQELYNQILPQCKILANLFNYNQGLNPYEIARKLSAYFVNFRDVENYLKTINYTTRETILLSLKYEIPVGASLKTINFFQKLNSFASVVGRDVLKLFCRAGFVESNLKIQSIINDEQNQQMLDRKTDIPNIRKLIQEVKSEVTKSVYIYDPQILPPELMPYVENLAELAMQTKLDRIAFRKAVQFMRVNGIKPIDNMPNINFEFTVGNKKFTFSKLPPNDMRGFILGKLSNSCQSIGENAEKIVLDGMSKANAGFYIITDQDGKIRAQSYAWLAGSSRDLDIVFDSFEYLGIEDEKIFKPAINKVREKLSGYQLRNLYIGVGGKTPNIAFQTQPRPDPIETDLYKYFDSATVYHIDKEIPIISVPEIQITTPKLKFSNFEELKNANRIISFYKLLNAIPYQSDFLKLHNNAINHLLQYISLEQLLEFYENKPLLALKLMTKGFEIKNLLDQNLTLTRLEETDDNTTTRLVLDLIEYNRNLTELIELGISLQSITEVYNINYTLGSMILRKAGEVKNLIIFGIAADELMDLAKKNSLLVTDMINYSHNITDLCDQHGCKVTKSKLIKLYEKYPHIAKVLMKYGKEVVRLPEMGIGIEELADLDMMDSAMSTFLDRNYQQVLNLFEEGFDPDALILICKGSPEVAKTFVSYTDNFHTLRSLGISNHKVLSIFKVTPEGAKFLVQYAPNLEKLTKAKLNPKKILKILTTNVEQAKFILKRGEEIADIIKYTELNSRDILNCNTGQLESLLDNHITPAVLKQGLETKKSGALSELLECMGNIGLGITKNLNCADSRSKRSMGECYEKIEFLYDPLREPSGHSSSSNLYSHSILAAIWSLPETQKSQMIEKALQLNSNLGDIFKEGGHNWSLREKTILGNYNAHITSLASLHPPILQEITSEKIANHDCIIYQNSKCSLVVLRTATHFKIYSLNLNYYQLLKTKDNIPYSSLEEFIDLFFSWRDQNNEYKIYALSPNIPKSTVDSITQIVNIPRNFEDDHKYLRASHDSKIEGLLLEDIYDLFAIDKKTIEVEKLHDQFFINNRIKLTLKIDKLHEILPRLDEEAQQALFNIIKKYNLIVSWNEEKVIDEHIKQMMNLYSAKVISEIKTKSQLNLEKLSELSWLTFEEVMGRHPDIQPELLNNIVETTKNLHSNLFNSKFVQSAATQGLFLLPNIIKSVNYGNYEGLIQTGEMIAGDMAINKLISSVVKYLPSERVALITKLPIASPIFKAVTIYSIVQLHKELNNMAPDAPEKDMVKHALIGEYATIGIIGAELLGLEMGPAWIILIGIQLMIETEDFKKLYKLDIPNYEALAMSLGFKQEKLQMILEERFFVEKVLSMHPEFLNNIGWKIFQVPQVNSMDWKNVGAEAIPRLIQTKLLNALEKSVVSSISEIASYGIYRLKVEYGYTIIPRIIGTPDYRIDKSIRTSRNWEKYTVEVSPANSTMVFDEFLNDQILRMPSNNWFLDQFTINNTIWHRVPLLPELSGFTATRANIHAPVSRDTDLSAVYINQNVVNHSPESLNHIHFSFDSRNGNIALNFTEKGLINMDLTNNAYLEQANLPLSYNNTTPYLLEILVTHQNLNTLIDFQKDITGEITVTSDSKRLTTFYIIDNNSCGYVKDISHNTVLSFLSPHNNHIQCLINDLNKNTTLSNANSNTILYNKSLGLIELNKDKKYLHINFNNNLINNTLTLGAKNLEIFNVQGQTANYSTLYIQPHTQSFNTTLIGNIIVSDGTGNLILNGSLSSTETIAFSRIKTINNVDVYSITTSYIYDILTTMARKVEFGKLSLAFYRQNILCIFNVNVSENNTIYFNGRVYQDKVLLVMDAQKTTLKVYDSEDNIHKTLITHYDSNAINLNQGYYLTCILDHVKLTNQVSQNSIILGEQPSNIEQYEYNLWADGRVYEFKTANNSVILHNFPNHYDNITINNIIYKLVDNELCVFEGTKHVIEGTDILYTKPSNHIDSQLTNICFFEPIEAADIECMNNTEISINNIIFKNISPDLRVSFNNFKMPIQVLAETAHCNIIYEG